MNVRQLFDMWGRINKGNVEFVGFELLGCI